MLFVSLREGQGIIKTWFRRFFSLRFNVQCPKSYLWLIATATGKQRRWDFFQLHVLRLAFDSKISRLMSQATRYEKASRTLMAARTLS